MDFVNRVIADAIRREDWTLLRRGLEAKSHLVQDAGARSFAYSPEAPDDLIAGANQEAAGQFALAVVSYQNALRLDDSGIPAKWIGDKLAAIQRDHPKEFAEGMQTFVSSPAPKNSPTPLPVLFYPTDSTNSATSNFPSSTKPGVGPSTNVPPSPPATK